MAQSNQFPGPEPGDPEDVAWTLTTAGTMWARGEMHEAVRWLRRAAEAAEENGNDLRAVSLARAAADLTSALPASPDQTSRMVVPPVSRPDNPPIQPLDDADAPYETDYTIPEGLAAVPPPFRPPPTPSRPVPSRPPPPPRSDPRGAPVASSRPSAPMPSRPAPPSASRPSHPAPSSVKPPSVAPASLGARPRQALRVAVEPSPDDRNLLLVRALADGDPVPPGHHEALLTALEPGAHLLSRKR